MSPNHECLIHTVLYGSSHSVSKLLVMRPYTLKVRLAMKTISKAKKEEGALRKLIGVCVCEPIVHGRVKSKVKRFIQKGGVILLSCATGQW